MNRKDRKNPDNARKKLRSLVVGAGTEQVAAGGRSHYETKVISHGETSKTKACCRKKTRHGAPR